MKLAIALAAYVGSIVAANVMAAHYGLVGVGFGLLVSAGTFAAGFALVARDFVHKHGGVLYALAAIGVGSALSWWLSTPGLAVASTIAFTAAELVDLAVFTPAKARLGFAPSILLSNVVSAPVDTLLFLQISGFGITAAAVEGQLVGKLVWATIVPLALYVIAANAATRRVAQAG